MKRAEDWFQPFIDKWLVETKTNSFSWVERAVAADTVWRLFSVEIDYP